jgi:2-iminobutanoate/2-iminopropanoate deaminase
VVKSTCLLSDIAHFAEMNETYARFYTGDCPARVAFAVKSLPMGALVEIETIAAK